MKNTPKCPWNVKIWRIDYQKQNAEVGNFAEITPNLPFTEYNYYEEFRGPFEKTELRRMKQIHPLHYMVENAGE